MGKKSKKKQDNASNEGEEVQEQIKKPQTDGKQSVELNEPETTTIEKQDSPPPKESTPESVAQPEKSGIDASLNQEIGKLRAQLEAVENERDDIQDQYDELLEKVAHIKTTLGQRLKNDVAELAKTRQELETIKSEKSALEAGKKAAEDQISDLQTKYDSDHAQLGYIELQLGEEKEKVQNLVAKVTQLTEDVEQQSNYAEHYRKSHQEAVSTSQKLEQDLNDKLNSSESQLLESKSRLDSSMKDNEELIKQVESLKLELEENTKKAAGVEELNETVREKNILIGKLRHEAVILNEHLTNALRIVKKDSEGQTVDKELISNLIVQFVTIPRGDTKKFEVLQLIASFLNWDEERRIEAGISRSGQQGSERSLGGFLGKFAEFMERESRKS